MTAPYYMLFPAVPLMATCFTLFNSPFLRRRVVVLRQAYTRHFQVRHSTRFAVQPAQWLNGSSTFVGRFHFRSTAGQHSDAPASVVDLGVVCIVQECRWRFCWGDGRAMIGALRIMAL